MKFVAEARFAPDSDARWLDEVPLGWAITKVRHLVRNIESGRSVNAADVPAAVGELGVLKTSCVSNSRFAPSENKTVVEAERELVLCPVRKGTLIVSRMNTPALVGAAGYVQESAPDIYLPDRLWQVSLRAHVEPRFVHYWTQTPLYRGQVQVACVGTSSSMQNLSQGDFGCMQLALPPTNEQRQIADFLDRETARIDTLIEKQQQLVETTLERRGAIVDEAYLEQRAKPLQLRRAIRFLTSGSRGWGDYYADDGERFLRIGNLSRTSLRLRGDVQFVRLPADVTEGSRTRLRAGDLLFSITAYLGSVAEVDSSWFGAYVSQHVALCRLDPSQFVSRYVGWYMLTTEGQNQLKQGGAGGTKQQLALDDIRGLTVPPAPLDEQHRVADYLDEQTAKVDVLIDKTQRFIELSKERRSALITAAVTGQIDVRNNETEESA